MSTLTTPSLRPLDEPSRILTIDVVRGVALLGIFAMNIMTFAMPFAAYFNPTAYDAVQFEGANRWTYFVLHTLFDLKMMTIFSMLFGVGVMVYAEKIARGGDPREVRWLWFKRMFILLVIGLVHAFFIWEGDILVGYAVCGMVFLWWMRRLPAWAMVAIALPMACIPQIGWVGQGVMYDWFVNADAPPEWLHYPEDMVQEQRDALTEFMNPTAEQAREIEERMRGGYLGIFTHRAKMLAQMYLFMIPTYLLWRGTAMMLLGAALYKWRVITGERTTRFYVALTLIGYAVGLPLVIGGIVYNSSIDFEPAKMIIYGSHYNAFGSIAVALGHVGLIILIARAAPTAWLVRSLSCVGRMALTNYLAQSLIGMTLFYGFGFALFGTVDRLQQQYIVLAVWIVQLVISPIWLKHFRFGPAEWAWRSMTYGKPQPMRRLLANVQDVG